MEYSKHSTCTKHENLRIRTRCGYWLELLSQAEKAPASSIQPLHRESNELVAIPISSINTARRNLRRDASG